MCPASSRDGYRPTPKGSGLQQLYIVSSDVVGTLVTERMLSSISVNVVRIKSPRELLDLLPIPALACFLIDFLLPEINGVQLMEKLRLNNCFHPCLFSAARIDPDMLMMAVNRGAYGFLRRPYQAIELTDMVHRALAHDQTLYPFIEEALDYQSDRDQLSRRERQILRLLEFGKTARNVADELKLSVRTVENHRVRIFAKLHIKRGSQLIYRATLLELFRAQGTIV